MRIGAKKMTSKVNSHILSIKTMQIFHQEIFVIKL